MNFSSDKPIHTETEDRFQRYPFSKRIAQTIVNRNNEECIVIGIYGAWGEGKTSVINFIEYELKNDKNIICIKFNPWRYNEENALLIQFFEKLATVLDANIKTPKEKIGSLLQKYGKLLKIEIPAVGSLGDVLEGTGGALAEVDVEALKDRIGNILKENKKKVVILIDDIDRLDKDEIHSVFRLVKLTADFSNTIYLLSFDEIMVSAAIGERFGAGNELSGQNFLEKIIQVPLKIPMAQPEALKQFCLELVDTAIKESKIVLTENEAQRFVSQFTNYVLPKLTTPRLAVRYGNTLSFSLPLLAGEVNTVDLMLIEAIKIFYPLHYDFIKNNPQYFIGSYSNDYSMGKKDNKINEIKEHLEKLGDLQSKNQKNRIQSLLEELFPRLNEAFHNHGHHKGNYNSWFKNKRVVSPKYFNRFFSYAILKGEMSDVAFNNFFTDIKEGSVDELSKSIILLISQSSPESFIHKLRSFEEELDWEISTKLCNAISISSDSFPSSDDFSFSFGYDSPKSQATIFIYQIIKKHSDTEDIYNLAKRLMTQSKEFHFAYSLNNWLRSGDTPEQKVFNDNQYTELSRILRERAIKEADNVPLFEHFTDFQILKYVFSSWANENKDGLTTYISEILSEDPNKVLDLIRAFTPMAYGGVRGDAFRSDFTKDIYNFFTSIFDSDYIKKAINSVYSPEEIAVEPVWIDMGENEQTDLNIVRQYEYWTRIQVK